MQRYKIDFTQAGAGLSRSDSIVIKAKSNKLARIKFCERLPAPGSDHLHIYDGYQIVMHQPDKPGDPYQVRYRDRHGNLWGITAHSRY